VESTARLFGKVPPAVHPQGIRGAAPFLLAIALLAFFFTWSTPYCQGHNADSVGFSIISVEKLTFFYWGQNRVVSLLPALTAWITDIHANLAAQVFLRAASAFALPWFAVLVLRPTRHGLTAYFLGVAAMLIAMANGSIHAFFAGGQPYALSVFLAGLAIHLGEVPAKRPAMRWIRRMAQWLGFVLAFLVNPSFFAILSVFLALRFFAHPRGRHLVPLGSAAAALLTTMALMRLHGETGGYSSFVLEMAAVQAVFKYLGRSVSSWGLSLVFVFYGSALVFHQWRHKKNRIRGLDGAHASGLIASQVALPLFLLMGGLAYSVAAIFSTHVKANLYSPRYFAVVFALTASSAGVLVAGLLPRNSVSSETPRRGDTPRGKAAWFSRERRFVFFSVLLCVAALVWRVDRFFGCESIEVQQPKRTHALAEIAERHGVDFIAGNYWAVWPVVFTLIGERGPPGKRERPVFGLTGKGEAMTDEIRTHLRRSAAVKILCIGPEPPDCYDWPLRIEEVLWPQQATFLEQGMAPKKTPYTVVRLERKGTTPQTGVPAGPRINFITKQQIKNGARRENGLVRVPAGKARMVLYGPYTTLEAGQHYRVRFELSETKASSDGFVLLADVVNKGGNRVFFRRPYRLSELRFSRDRQWLDFTFFIPEETNDVDFVEFRLRTAEGASFSIHESSIFWVAPPPLR
jgi:hypothetical protein